ncbi:MAG: hypothetical protein ACE5Z5_13240 [Candidatus Bathyarchaeia archaeon]
MGNLSARAIQVVKARIGLISNNHSLIHNPEYFEGIPHPAVVSGNGYHIQAQMANFQINPIEYLPPPSLDGYFYIFDYKGVEPHVIVTEDRVTTVGDWSSLERTTRDIRYSLLANQGLLFRFILTVLEREYGIYNFHACALYDEGENRMVVALGERGSGKSALMLAALDRGLFKLFGTEIVHIGITNKGVTFYKGTLRNNVRAGHLIYDFPKIAEEIGVKFAELDDPWGTKVGVDLHRYGAESDVVVDPEIVFVIPRIEEESTACRFSEADKRKSVRTLMENLCDKITTLAVMYESVPIGSLDTPWLMRRRLKFVERLMNEGRVTEVVSLFAGPKNCLEGWL